MRTNSDTQSGRGRAAPTPGRALRSAAAPLVLAVALSACAARQTPPIAPAPPGEAAGAPSAANLGGPRFTEADARFLRGMMMHHEQALAMTALVAGRTDTRAIHLLAERIEVSQRDEIQQMENWLRARGLEVRGPAAGHGHHPGQHAGMPGMLTEEQLARLTAARGREFDRLFLEYMIQHHEGALTMVEELLATPGAGQEVEIYRIASDVVADQQAEIQRMQRVLATLQ